MKCVITKNVYTCTMEKLLTVNHEFATCRVCECTVLHRSVQVLGSVYLILDTLCSNSTKYVLIKLHLLCQVCFNQVQSASCFMIQVIRYSHYALTTLKVCPSWLTYLRFHPMTISISHFYGSSFWFQFICCCILHVVTL